MPDRTCRDCGADISVLHHNAKLCIACRPDAVKNRTQQRRAQYPQRSCASCGIDISELHGNVRRCITCRTSGPPRPVRHCKDCGCSITALYVLAQRCAACRAPKSARLNPRKHGKCIGATCYCNRQTLAGMSDLGSAEIAKKYGVTQQTINYWRGKFDLPRPPVVPPVYGGNQKYGTNRDFFAVIDTPAKAYILGFIIADGCVHKNGKGVAIAIQRTDIALLRAIAAEVGCTAPMGRKAPSVRDRACRWPYSTSVAGS